MTPQEASGGPNQGPAPTPAAETAWVPAPQTSRISMSLLRVSPTGDSLLMVKQPGPRPRARRRSPPREPALGAGARRTRWRPPEPRAGALPDDGALRARERGCGRQGGGGWRRRRGGAWGLRGGGPGGGLRVAAAPRAASGVASSCTAAAAAAAGRRARSKPYSCPECGKSFRRKQGA